MNEMIKAKCGFCNTEFDNIGKETIKKRLVGKVRVRLCPNCHAILGIYGV